MFFPVSLLPCNMTVMRGILVIAFGHKPHGFQWICANWFQTVSGLLPHSLGLTSHHDESLIRPLGTKITMETE